MSISSRYPEGVTLFDLYDLGYELAPPEPGKPWLRPVSQDDEDL